MRARHSRAAWPSLCVRKTSPQVEVDRWTEANMPVNPEDELAGPCGLDGPAARDSRSRCLAKEDAAPFLTVRRE